MLGFDQKYLPISFVVQRHARLSQESRDVRLSGGIPAGLGEQPVDGGDGHLLSGEGEGV